ncbi:probable 3-hydroxybutyryl-CoA dehydrogenase [Anneissia japonica]|uniref:probable 3-hydroxybutyryl-CoA dehydrogenase n=1 Tax=Anneissia japonica TaxID=1529436 RepID=UPI0014257E9A|nr:probable 3-hydroxybutyryl-CoA dehydrogenase [Anneissia japonica]
MVKVAVLGCGILGTKIAGCLAYHGHLVKIYDNDARALDALYTNLESDKEDLKKDELMVQRQFLGQVLCMGRLEEAVQDAEFIFEAVIDNMEVKKDLLERTSHLCSSSTIIVTNTLYLDVNEIVERVAYKERTLGLRFLHPVYAIPEVEITMTRMTSTEVLEKVKLFLEKMGKTLFFRSGKEPLILTPQQIESRKIARREQIRRQQGLPGLLTVALPQLGHDGNMVPNQDDEFASPTNDRDCAICMDRLRNCLLCPCHHMVTCNECAKMLFNRKDYCPVCRKSILEIIRVYTS